MTGEREGLQCPFDAPRDVGALPEISQASSQITIADIFFCMFAVSLSLMTLFQRWGDFEAMRSMHGLSVVLAALGASVFFTANRIRRTGGRSFFAMAPGHFVALACAGYLAMHVFQYFVSFLNTRYVGSPIHFLAQMAQPAWCVALSLVLLLRTKSSLHWKVCFISSLVYGLLSGLYMAANILRSNSDLSTSLNIALPYLWRASFGSWLFAILLLVTAYMIDVISRQKRDWLHHAGVWLNLGVSGAALFEDPFYSRQISALLYAWFHEAFEWLYREVFF